MRTKTILLLGLLCAAVLIVVGVAGFSVAAAEDALRTKHTEHVVRPAADSDIVVPAGTERQRALTAYVLGVISGWPPAKIEMVPLEDVAESIGRVAALDAPAWPDDVTGARTADLLASLAYFEGARFAKYVDDGVCNESAFRQHNALAHYGTCDHGLAHSLWQIHEITLLDPREEASAAALRDRTFAAHVALRLARQSIAATGTLRYYTGEWSGPCPKADDRMKFADKAWQEHPYEPPAE